MDKELPESEQRVTPPKAFVRLTKSQLNDSPPFYRGTIPQRRTLSVEDLADRMVEHRTSYHRETIIEIYRVMTSEECFIPPARVFINSSTLLGFQCPLALTPGEWQVVVATQYNHSHRPYLQPRYDYHDLTVCDATAP